MLIFIDGHNDPGSGHVGNGMFIPKLKKTAEKVDIILGLQWKRK